VRRGGDGGRNTLARRTRTPALLALGEDPRITAAVVITDGDIAFPPDPVPYAVLWALPRPNATFQPPYGRVIVMQREGVS
jgi:hypothetical protein